MVSRMDKNVLDSIKRQIDENSCLAMVKDDNSVYYAVNNKFKALRQGGRLAIEKMLKSRYGLAVFCPSNYAFATFDLKLDYKIDLLPIENRLYNSANKNWGTKHWYYSKLQFYTGGEGRAFSCAEKKIVGYLSSKGDESISALTDVPLLNGYIFVTKRPCYYCIPVSRGFYYLDNRNFYRLDYFPISNNSFGVSVDKLSWR